MRQKITNALVVTDAGNVDLQITTEQGDDKPLYDAIDEFAEEKLGQDLEMLAKNGNLALLNQRIDERGIDVSQVERTAAHEVKEIHDTREL